MKFFIGLILFNNYQNNSQVQLQNIFNGPMFEFMLISLQESLKKSFDLLENYYLSYLIKQNQLYIFICVFLICIVLYKKVSIINIMHCCLCTIFPLNIFWYCHLVLYVCEQLEIHFQMWSLIYFSKQFLI